MFSRSLRNYTGQRPYLIVSDVVMPGLDGCELCKRIRGDLQLTQTPVILMNGGHCPKLEDSGANTFIPKPFDISQLEDAVKSLIY